MTPDAARDYSKYHRLQSRVWCDRHSEIASAERMRKYRRDVQARRKDADACCRMTTRLRVRRMKAVPTRLFNWAHSGTSNNTCTP